MQLEKEFKTSPFDQGFEQTMVNIIFTYNWCSSKMKKLVTPYDITTQQYNVLRILQLEYPDPATINLIRSKMMDKMSDASRIVERLIHKGLVSKSANLIDRRASDIQINEQGLKLLDQLHKNPLITELFTSNLTENEAKQLNQLLNKLRG